MFKMLKIRWNTLPASCKYNQLRRDTSSSDRYNNNNAASITISIILLLLPFVFWIVSSYQVIVNKWAFFSFYEIYKVLNTDYESTFFYMRDVMYMGLSCRQVWKACIGFLRVSHYSPVTAYCRHAKRVGRHVGRHVIRQVGSCLNPTLRDFSYILETIPATAAWREKEKTRVYIFTGSLKTCLK